MINKKNILALTLSGLICPAFAEVDMNNFEIKGIKLGATLEEARKAMEANCEGAPDKKVKDGITLVNCSLGGDKKNLVEFMAMDKVYHVIDGQLVEVESGASKEGIKRSMLLKLLEKYGKPLVHANGEVTLEFTSSDKFSQLKAEDAVCWGDCKRMYNTNTGRQIINYGKSAFIVAFFEGSGSGKNGGGRPSFGFNGKKGKSILVRRFLFDSTIKSVAVKSAKDKANAAYKEKAKESQEKSKKIANGVDL